MDEKQTKSTSKFLSLVLRHRPEKIGLSLDNAGWVSVETLLSAMAKFGKPITLQWLELVVHSNDKQRFEFSNDGQMIRARQGHSIEIELGYKPCQPPDVLIHGTPKKFVASIRETGLQKRQRHHVHLHADQNVALDVGGRRGKAVLLSIRSKEMFDQGHEFFVTENDVWLTDHVPPEFIDFPPNEIL